MGRINQSASNVCWDSLYPIHHTLCYTSLILGYLNTAKFKYTGLWKHTDSTSYIVKKICWKRWCSHIMLLVNVYNTSNRIHVNVLKFQYVENLQKTKLNQLFVNSHHFSLFSKRSLPLLLHYSQRLFPLLNLLIV